MVDANGFIAKEIKYAIKAPSQNRCGKVANMEGLCNIDGRIINADHFSPTHVRRTVSRVLVLDAHKHVLREPFTAHFKVEIAIYSAHFGNYLIRNVACRQLLGDLHGRFSKRLCKFKTGQSVITERGIGRNGDCQRNFL